MTEKLRIELRRFFKKRSGRRPLVLPVLDGDLTGSWPNQTLSRRISEFVGVALFALALIWLISLVTYEPTDPVWFFTTSALHPPANFVGRVGAFVSELSFQLLGYAAYLVPAVIAWAGWYCFWCQPFEAIYTKLIRHACCSSAAAARSSASSSAAPTCRARRSTPADRSAAWLGAWFAEYLNRTGSIIVIMTLMVLSVILSTQFSLRPDVRQRQPGIARPVGAQRRLPPRLARRPAQTEAAPRGDRASTPRRLRPRR